MCVWPTSTAALRRRRPDERCPRRTGGRLSRPCRRPDRWRRLPHGTGGGEFLAAPLAGVLLRLAAGPGSVMGNGNITMTGTGRELLSNPDVRVAYLEGGHPPETPR